MNEDPATLARRRKSLVMILAVVAFFAAYAIANTALGIGEAVSAVIAVVVFAGALFALHRRLVTPLQQR